MFINCLNRFIISSDVNIFCRIKTGRIIFVLMIFSLADVKSKEYEWRIVNDGQAIGKKKLEDLNGTKQVFQGQAWMVSQKAENHAIFDKKAWLLLIGAVRSENNNGSDENFNEELENFWVEDRYLTKLSDFSPINLKWSIRFFAIVIGDWCHYYNFTKNGDVQIMDCSGEHTSEIGKGKIYMAGNLMQIRPNQGFAGAFTFDPVSQTMSYSGLKDGVDFVQRRFFENNTPLYLGRTQGESGICVLDCSKALSVRKKSRIKSTGVSD